MFTTLLIPLDGSALAERALPFAVALASASRGKLILLRLTGPLGWSLDPDADQPATMELDTVAERLQRQGLQVEPLLRHGYRADVGRDICIIGAERGVDLIVMSTHGQGGLGRWIYGSTADQVLRNTEVPLLLIPASCGGPWPDDRPFRILVPLDGSDLAREALDPALAFADALGGELLLLHVSNPPDEARLGPEIGVTEARAQLELVAGRLRAAGRNPELHAMVGAPAAVIPRVADEQRADLIVMATHGRGGLGRLVLGSVATATVQRATVPLLLMRPAALRDRRTAQPPDTAAEPPAAQPLVPVPLTAGELELAERAIGKLFAMPESEWYQTEPLRQLLAKLEHARTGSIGSAETTTIIWPSGMNPA